MSEAIDDIRVDGPGSGPLPAVLMYHSVAPYDQDPYLVTVRPDRFEQQLRWLDRRGLRGTSMRELLTTTADRGLAVASHRPARAAAHLHRGPRRVAATARQAVPAPTAVPAARTAVSSDLTVLHAVQPTDAGVAGYVAAVAADQLARGWRVMVACPRGGRLAADLAARGVPRLPWPATRAPGAGTVPETQRLRRLIRAVQPDVGAPALGKGGAGVPAGPARHPPHAVPTARLVVAGSPRRDRARRARLGAARGPPIAIRSRLAAWDLADTAIRSRMAVSTTWRRRPTADDGGPRASVMRLSVQGRLRGVDVAEHRLALAINGRERLLETRLVPFSMPGGHPTAGNGHAQLGSVAIVGLGYVGLPTALALLGRASRITGFDISDDRLRAIESGDVDLSDLDRVRLAAANGDESFQLTNDSAALADSDAVIVCVPTPVDENRIPDLTALQGACQTVVEHAHPGQTIILTSTSFAGTTRQLLIEPLHQRGLTVGEDVYVAFSPERIDPGNPDHVQRETPRVVGGATAGCSDRAARVIGQLTDAVYLVSSPEAAELTKLYENIFRAVTLALANEFADVCGTLGLDPIEVTLAAATKPYGFLGTFPGPGVGGHCIPCDPHYLLWQLRGRNRPTPLIEQAMQSIHARPARVVERAAEVLAADGRSLAGARVIVVGVSYKAGVCDVRESPALPIIDGLAGRGADVQYSDPLVPTIRTPQGQLMHSVAAPSGAGWDLAVVHVLHPGLDDDWIGDCPRVLDATYRFDGAAQRSVV